MTVYSKLSYTYLWKTKQNPGISEIVIKDREFIEHRILQKVNKLFTHFCPSFLLRESLLIKSSTNESIKSRQ